MSTTSIFSTLVTGLAIARACCGAEPVSPRAVADEPLGSDYPYPGFSMVVGWKDGLSFLLVPVENPNYPPPSGE